MIEALLTKLIPSAITEEFFEEKELKFVEGHWMSRPLRIEFPGADRVTNMDKTIQEKAWSFQVEQSRSKVSHYLNVL